MIGISVLDVILFAQNFSRTVDHYCLVNWSVSLNQNQIVYRKANCVTTYCTIIYKP